MESKLLPTGNQQVEEAAVIVADLKGIIQKVIALVSEDKLPNILERI